MSELTTFDDMTIEAIEVACQSAFEECESVFRAIDSKKNQLEIFGRLLTAAKKKVAHGEWENWLTDTFSGRLKLRTAQLWMSKAQKVALLESGEVTEIAPRSERKTGRVQVSKPEPVERSGNPGQLDENAVPAEPRSNTKHSEATARARESDRPVPAVVTPEIVEDFVELNKSPWIKVEEALCVVAEESPLLEAKEKKDLAKKLRKRADELDPPKKFRPPDVDDVRAYCLERKNRVDAEAFVAFYAQQDWRLANGNKMGDWKAAIITWEKRDDSGNRNSSGNRITTGRIKPAPVDESKIEYV
jgi:hypothetical protein